MHNKFLREIIAIECTPSTAYASTAAEGDHVELTGSADLEVQKVTTAGSTTYVGRVVTLRKNAAGTVVGVTVETGAIALETMTAGAAIAAPGPVVFDTDGKVIAYVPWSAISNIALATSDTYTDAAVNTAVNGLTLSGGHDPNAVFGLALDTPSGADETVLVLRYK